MIKHHFLLYIIFVAETVFVVQKEKKIGMKVQY
jgi:hypothetical protein